MLQHQKIAPNDHVRLIFTKIPNFMDLADKKDDCARFIHYLQYGYIKVELIYNTMYIEIYDLKDRMPSKEFLNWFIWYQTHVHPSKIQEDTMAQLYYINTDQNGILVEYAEKITDMYPIMDSGRLCNMTPDDVVNLESGNTTSVRLRLGFHVVRQRSNIISAEANDMLKQNPLAPIDYTIAGTRLSTLSWNDPHLSSLGDSIYTPIEFPSELGSKDWREEDLSCHRRDWEPGSESKNTK